MARRAAEARGSGPEAETVRRLRVMRYDPAWRARYGKPNFFGIARLSGLFPHRLYTTIILRGQLGPEANGRLGPLVKAVFEGRSRVVGRGPDGYRIIGEPIGTIWFQDRK